MPKKSSKSTYRPGGEWRSDGGRSELVINSYEAEVQAMDADFRPSTYGGRVHWAWRVKLKSKFSKRKVAKGRARERFQAMQQAQDAIRNDMLGALSQLAFVEADLHKKVDEADPPPF